MSRIEFGEAGLVVCVELGGGDGGPIVCVEGGGGEGGALVSVEGGGGEGSVTGDPDGLGVRDLTGERGQALWKRSHLVINNMSYEAPTKLVSIYYGPPNSRVWSQ